MTVDPRLSNATEARGQARASSVDREGVIDVIKAAFADGRLTREELLERVERAHTSRTRAELAALSADLPSGAPGPLPPVASAPAAQLTGADSRQTNSLATASFVCGLIPLLPATLAAITLGTVAHRQIKQTGQRGAALATAGLALGAFWILLTLVVLFALR